MSPSSQRPERPRADALTRARRLLALAVALAAAWAAYRPVVRGYFFADDFLSLYDLANGGGWDFLVRMHAGHSNVLRNLVFWVTWMAVGPASAPYFWTVLVTHLVAVAAFFAVALRATRSTAVACLGAVLWGTCPTNAGTLEWYSVFGQVLACVLVLAALFVLLGARAAPGGMTARRIAGCGLLVMAAASCFGMGLVVVMVTPLIVWLLAPAPGLSRRAWLVTAAIPLAMGVLYFGQRAASEALAGAPERTGLELLPMIDVLGGTIETFVNFLGVAMAALVRGPWSIDIPWPTRGSLLAAATGAVLLAAGLLAGDRRSRRLLLALALLTAAPYGAVALARIQLFTVLDMSPVQVARTPRYHYLPTAMLALGLCVAVAALVRRTAPRAGGAVVAGVLALVLAAEVGRPRPVKTHGRTRLGVSLVVDAVRRAIAAAPPGGTVRIPNRVFAPASMLVAARPERFPGIVAVYLIFFPPDELDGRRVLFEAQTPRVLEARDAGGRIAEVLVPPAGGYRPPPYARPAPATR